MKYIYKLLSCLSEVDKEHVRFSHAVFSGTAGLRHLSCVLAILNLWGAPSAFAGTETEAAAAFRAFCYDPMRTERRLERPDLSQGWSIAEIDPETGPAFMQGFEGDIYIRTLASDETQLLMMKAPPEAGEESGAQHLKSASCTLAHLGEVEPDVLIGHLEQTVFPLKGYQMNSGHAMSLRLPAGWREWCWTVMPKRDMSDWKLEKHNNYPRRSACIYITNDRQYNFTDLVTIRIAEKAGDSGVLLLQLDRTFKPRKDN